MLYNVREYHRPTDLAEALRLLRRTDMKTVALAGGVSVVGQGTPDIEAVVDLDGLNLDFVDITGISIRLGAMARLQALVDQLGHVGSGVFAEAARRMAGLNLRYAATLGGALAGGDADSPLGVVLAVLDARLTLYDEQEHIERWVDLATRPSRVWTRGAIITAVSFDYSDRLAMAYEQVARTPADYPIVCAAALANPSSPSVTVSIGGLLTYPVVGGLSGNAEALDSFLDELIARHENESAIRSDFRGSAEYRRQMARILSRRALNGAGLRSQ